MCVELDGKQAEDEEEEAAAVAAEAEAEAEDGEKRNDGARPAVPITHDIRKSSKRKTTAAVMPAKPTKDPCQWALSRQLSCRVELLSWACQS